jgi:hypothetical protein
MKLGTKSVLFGYHCILLHGWFVLWGWFSLHRFRRVRIGSQDRLGKLNDGSIITLHRGVFTSLWDYRLWLSCFLHDVGYWGKPNMDGPEGETHPEWAATFMRKRYGDAWGDFCLYHSRFYAKRDGKAPSALCFPDKVAFLKYPMWLLVLLTTATGEYDEYKTNYMRDNPGMAPFANAHEWAQGVKIYVTKWVADHKDGAEDTSTTIREHKS